MARPSRSDFGRSRRSVFEIIRPGVPLLLEEAKHLFRARTEGTMGEEDGKNSRVPGFVPFEAAVMESPGPGAFIGVVSQTFAVPSTLAVTMRDPSRLNSAEGPDRCAP